MVAGLFTKVWIIHTETQNDRGYVWALGYLTVSLSMAPGQEGVSNTDFILMISFFEDDPELTNSILDLWRT
jgi:hypothetical protein